MDPLRSIPKLETLVRKTRPELAVARGTGIERWPRILDWGARVKLTTRQLAKGRVQGMASPPAVVASSELDQIDALLSAASKR